MKREYNKQMEKSKAFSCATFVYFLIFAMFVLVRVLSSFGLLSLGTAGDYLFTVIVQVVLMLGGAIFLYPALRKTDRKKVLGEFGIKKPSTKVVVLSILLGVVVFFLNGFVSDIFNSLIELFGYEHNYGSGVSSYSFASLVLNIIFTALLPAICEEVAHRGMLLKAYSPLGVWKAIFLSSLMFGLLHLNIEQFFYATIIGVFLAFLTMSTNSIVPAMIVHFMNNALSTYRTFSIVNGLPFGKVVMWFSAVTSSNIFLGMLLSILVICVLAYLLFKLLAYLTHTRMREDAQALQNWLNKQIMREEYLLDLESAKFDATGQAGKNFDPEEGIKKILLLEGENENFKPSPYSKVLASMTLIMGVVLTIFTFVWGAI